MNILWLKLFFTLLISMKSSEAISVDCKYFTSTWPYMNGSSYSCVVQNIAAFNGARKTIEDARGKHSAGYANAFVNGFQLTNAFELTQFPIKLDQLFKNLHVIEISGSESLYEVTQADLQVFKNLKYLSLQNNQLKFLRNDVFAANTNLEVINLSNNKISHIEGNVFNRLNKLRVLNLNNNACCSLTFAETRADVQDLLVIVKNGGCTNEFFTKFEKEQKQNAETKKQIQAKTQEVTKHFKIASELRAEIAKLKKASETNDFIKIRLNELLALSQQMVRNDNQLLTGQRKIGDKFDSFSYQLTTMRSQEEQLRSCIDNTKRLESELGRTNVSNKHPGSG